MRAALRAASFLPICLFIEAARHIAIFMPIAIFRYYADAIDTLLISLIFSMLPLCCVADAAAATCLRVTLILFTPLMTP